MFGHKESHYKKVLGMDFELGMRCRDVFRQGNQIKANLDQLTKLIAKFLNMKNHQKASIQFLANFPSRNSLNLIDTQMNINRSNQVNGYRFLKKC